MPAPRLLPLVSALALVAGLLLLAPAADAAVYTSTGVRCTKVGTAGANRIVGTAKRDVICGRGGNDVIDGRGGNDLIDGGPGNDTLRGSIGNDRLLGGLGHDSMSGQAGADTVTGATGNDRIDAGAGNDVVDAGPGHDSVQGGTGNDRVTGGDGNDTESGSSGNDVLLGQGGNDDLLGGAGSDTINGGTGTNWCDATSTEPDTGCKTDLQVPQVHEFSVSSTTVDVTDGPVAVTATYHLTDDTGVRVGVGGPHLVKGTVRDGWWTSRWVMPQYATPGSREWAVNATDRVGHSGGRLFPDAFTVVNDHPDLAPPVVQSMTTSASTVDVRSAAKNVTGTVRITDDRAGVSRALLCPAHMVNGNVWSNEACESMDRVSGTNQNGTWRATATIPRGAVGGQWNFQVWVDDASDNHPTQYFFGPDQVQWENAHSDTEPWWKPLPSGAGRLTVVGTSDNNAPQLTSMSLNPATVDVSTQTRTVSFDVAATDVEGISGLGVTVQGQDGDSVDVGTDESPVLISGTTKNGTWRLQIPVAQGTPPGTYVIQLWLQDATHFTSWFSPGSNTYDPSQHLFTPEQTPNGAVITVQ